MEMEEWKKREGIKDRLINKEKNIHRKNPNF